MKNQAVMFDLDGTLADTLADIAAAGNHMLSQFSQAPLPMQRYRYLAGQGVRYLVREALNTHDSDDRIERGIALVEGFYAQHEHERTVAYPGVDDLLEALSRRGVAMAVLSNKPDAPARHLVAHLFADLEFQAVRGHRDGAALKPDPAAALEIARELAIPPENWLYVGDTAVDMQTGRGAGMTTVGVTWGFRDEPELLESGAQAIIHEPMQLLECLLCEAS